MITEEGFVPLEIPVPPMLEQALGYPGHSRRIPEYCAFYWAKSGDEAAFHDGMLSGVGMLNNDAFLAFVEHRIVVRSLLPYNIGSADSDADFWLVLERQEPRKLYIAPAKSAYLFLVQKALSDTSQEPHHAVESIDDSEFLLLQALTVSNGSETPSVVSHERIVQAMNDERQHLAWLVAWLDSN